MKKAHLFFCLLLVATACKKEGPLSTSNPSPKQYPSISSLARTAQEEDSLLRDMFAKDTVSLDSITIEYFLDGVAVDSVDLPDSVHKLYPIFSSTKNVGDSSAVVTVRTFTTHSNFLTFGQNNGLNFSDVEDFIADVHTEADSYGYMDLEDDEELPSEFVDFNQMKYEEAFGQPKTTVAGLKVWDDIVPYGTNTILPLSSHPALINWNDKIGCYQRYNFTVNVYGYTWFFDRTLYRNPIGIIWSWSFSNISFASSFIHWYYNNRVSSYVTI